MVASLALFLFTLPLVEAPKNVALLLYLLAWCARAWITHDLGGRWDRFDTAFAAMFGSALISGALGYAGDVPGVVRVIGLAWLVKRAPLDMRQLPWLAGAACLGLAIAMPFGAIPFLQGRKLFFELPSVGHVNQSALYIAIMCGAGFGWWLQGAQGGVAGWRRWLLAAFATVFCAGLLVGASRAAILAGVAAILVIVLAVETGELHPERRRLLKRAAWTLAGLAGLVAGLTALAPDLSHGKLTPEKLLGTFSTETRMRHWRIAVEGWRERPMFGWGPDYFQNLTVDEVCAWRAERGEDCDRSRYETTKHAHSLYVGTLVERGLVGVAALALLLTAWIAALARSARTADRSPLWVASAAGLVVVLVGGLFNTTMRVEHGSLALLFLGLWLAARRPQLS